MLISTDGGKTFTEEFTPRGLIIDFEVDPADPERIIASTEKELFRTEDGGKSWRPLTPAKGIRLSWPQPKALYRADADGTIASPRTAARAGRTSARRRRALRAARHRPEGAVPRPQRRLDPRDAPTEVRHGATASGPDAVAALLLVAAPAARRALAGPRRRRRGRLRLRRRGLAEHAHRDAAAATGSSSATRPPTRGWTSARATRAR